MYTFSGRNVYIEQLTTENDYQLFELMKNNENEYRFYVSDQPIPQTFEEFRESLKRFFNYDRIYQFLVYRKRDHKLIGTIFFYTEDNEVKISAFFIPEARKTILPAEALGASILFALDVYCLFLFLSYLDKAFDEVWQNSQDLKISLREAAIITALKRLFDKQIKNSF